MPRRHTPLFLASSILGCLVALPSSAAPPHSTVGQFLVEVAAAKRLGTSGPGGALAALQTAGYPMPGLRLDKPLTEGDVTAISHALGLRVSTTRPGEPFDEADVHAFLQLFGRELGAKPGDPAQARGSDNDPPGPYPRPEGAADPAEKGKGKKKGLFKSPSDPH